MKKLAIVMTLLLCAGAVQAGPIYDLQIGGAYVEGDYVNVICAVVTASATYGVAVAETPFGPGNSVWVYLGYGHGLVEGDIVNVYGVYEEYYDELTEINVYNYTSADPAAYCTVVGTCAELPPPIVVTAAQIMADPEPYESSIVWIRDGFVVTELLSYGEWSAISYEDGSTVILFDDYWYDETVLAVDDCANWGIGMWTESFGAYKLEAFADGFPLTGCAVPAEQETFGGVKAMYR